MNVSEALKKIDAPRGVTTVIEALLSGDLGPIEPPDKSQTSLQHARAQLKAVRREQDQCGSDAAYWGYMGTVSYWRAVVDILKAAELVGDDNLPDVPDPERGVVVMDACANVESYGRSVLKAAKEASRE